MYYVEQNMQIPEGVFLESHVICQKQDCYQFSVYYMCTAHKTVHKTLSLNKRYIMKTYLYNFDHWNPTFI